MSSKEVRKSKVDDDALITLARVICSHLTEYKMFFTSFDNQIFTEDYEERVLKPLISNSQNILSDKFFLKSQAKETADKEDARKVLRRRLKILEFYVMSKFANNKAILDEFLLHTVGTTYRNADALIGFTKDTLVKVETYKSELFDAGVTDTLIANIEDAKNNLNTQRRQQVETMRKRKVKTKDRINRVNRLWEELTKIQDVARILFFANPEIGALFELPKGKKSKATDVAEEQEQVPAE